MIITAAIVVLLGIFAAIILHQAEQNREKEYIQKARESYSEGDFEGALLFLRRMESQNKDSEALMLMADCYEALGNYERALQMLRKLNTSDPLITNRIQTVEQLRSKQEQENYISIAGIMLERDTRSAELDNLEITDDQMSDVAALYALDSLSLQNNRISNISALKTLGGLDNLNLAGNQIRDLAPLAELKGLRFLDLDYNPVQSVNALEKLNSLNRLSLIGTGLNQESLYALSTALPHCAIRYSEGESQAVLLSGNSVSLEIEELNLHDSGLTDVSALGNFTKLKILDLSNNEITDLRPLMELPNLEILDISHNMVSDLRPLIGLPLLTKLDASDNLITETTSVGSVTGLEELNLSGNSILDYSGIGKLMKLGKLDLSDTGITDAGLPYLYPLTRLQTLDLQDNEGLSDIAIGALKSAITGCSVLLPELVYEIDLAGHLVRSDEKKISFPCCGMKDIRGLDRMSRLEELNLSGNEISSLYQFEISPSRTTLRIINLSGNQITDVLSLSGLTMIEELDLSGNRIEVVNGLKQLATLRRLNLSDNPIPPESLADLKYALPNCEIQFDTY